MELFKTHFLNSGSTYRKKPNEKRLNIVTKKVVVADYSASDDDDSAKVTRELDGLESGTSHVRSFSNQNSPVSSSSGGLSSPPGILIKQEKFEKSVFRVSPTLQLKESKEFRLHESSLESTGSSSSSGSSSSNRGTSSSLGETDDDLEALERGNTKACVSQISTDGKPVKERNSRTNKFVDVEAGDHVHPENSKKKSEDYVGDVSKEGKKHGRGRLVYESGEVYYGDWANNRKHGTGTFIYVNGDKYTGAFHKGKKSGFGDFLFASLGDSYTGGFRADVIHGFGVYRYKDGCEYDGQFVDGLKDGKGTQKYASEAQYKGYWNADKPHGKGKYTFSSGKVFKGRFVDGEIDGSGMMTLPNSPQIFLAVFDMGKLISIEPISVSKNDADDVSDAGSVKDDFE
jgi:hypothetical protein